MKKLNYLCIVALIALFGCDVLNQEPEVAISSEIAIRDQKSAEAALNGLYSQLQSSDYYGDNFYVTSDVTSDISQSIGTWDFYREMDTYVTSAGNLENRNLWSQAYATVNQANNLITILPALEEVPQEAKDQILGEAYFIRALAFFDLTRTFGGVPGVAGTLGIPIVLEPSNIINESSFPDRAGIEESYAQVESDLTEAVNRLSGASEPTRVSEAAAKALLSRLYLYYQQDFDMVEQFATEVINDYSYALVGNYADIFINESTAESIFELAFNSADQSGIRNWYFPSSAGGRGDIALHEEFVAFVQSRPEDERGELIEFDANVGVFYPAKYQKAGDIDNIQILRLAEMYMNRAEARVRKSTPDLAGALDDLNAIRARAGLADTTGAGVDTSEEIMEAIELERSVEFFEEGHRWFNLVRRGRALTVLEGVDRKNSDPVSLSSEGRMVFPIPARDIDANPNIEQNEAYQ